MPNAADELRGTTSSTANKVAQFRPAQLRPQPISNRGTTSSTANIKDTGNDAATSGLASRGDASNATGDSGIEDGFPKREPSTYASADGLHDPKSAIERLRRIKGEPAPPYRPEPGGLAARLLTAAAAQRERRAEELGLTEGRLPSRCADDPRIHRCACGEIDIQGFGWSHQEPERTRWYCTACASPRLSAGPVREGRRA